MRFEGDLTDRRRLAQLDKTLASDPNDVDANCQKGKILLDLCMDDEALGCFERVLQRDPSSMPSWIGKGSNSSSL